MHACLPVAGCSQDAAGSFCAGASSMWGSEAPCDAQPSIIHTANHPPTTEGGAHHPGLRRPRDPRRVGRHCASAARPGAPAHGAATPGPCRRPWRPRRRAGAGPANPHAHALARPRRSGAPRCASRQLLCVRGGAAQRLPPRPLLTRPPPPQPPPSSATRQAGRERAGSQHRQHE